MYIYEGEGGYIYIVSGIRLLQYIQQTGVTPPRLIK